MPGLCTTEGVAGLLEKPVGALELPLSTWTASLGRDASHAIEFVIERDASSPLSASAVQGFRDQGFLAVGGLCSAEERSWIRSRLMDLFASQAGRDEGNQFDMLGPDLKPGGAVQPQIIKPGIYAPELLRTAYFRKVSAIARQLLGPDALFSFDHSILKPAGSGTATPWHQDEAHQDDPKFQYKQVSFWMPLQDATLENGCMRYIPASNLGPLLPHRDFNNDPRIHAIECPTEHFDESAAVAMPIPAGCSILHDGRTLHSALPNRADHARLAYVLAFIGPPLPRTEPQRYAWIAGKRTAALDRGIGWRRHGGGLVLLLRRLRGLLSDPGKIRITLRKIAYVAKANWARWWGPRDS